MKIARDDIWLLQTRLEFKEGNLDQLYIAIVSREHRMYYLPSTNNVYSEQGTKSISAVSDYRNTFETLFAEFPEDALKHDVGKPICSDAKLHSNAREIKSLDETIDIETKFNNLVGDNYGVVDLEEVKEFQAFLDRNFNVPTLKNFLAAFTRQVKYLTEEEEARAQYAFFKPDFKKKKNAPSFEQ